MGDEPGARAALRLGFLAVVRALAGRTAAIVTAEGNQVGPRGIIPSRSNRHDDYSYEIPVRRLTSIATVTSTPPVTD